MLNPKNVFPILICVIALVFYFNFVSPFKIDKVDTVVSEYEDLNSAFEKAQNQLSLTELRNKKNSLSLNELNVLENFVPARLKSLTFVYNLTQLANQNRLLTKNIQLAVVDDVQEDGPNKTKDSKLILELTLDGRYEDFVRWLSLIENANTLITVDNFRATKNNPTSEVITFNVRLLVYALHID